jgi:DNA-binding NarL/FixJ family response regulator
VLAHHPEVLLLDWTLPGEGRSVLARVRAEAPGTRVCVLSMHQDGVTVREALGAGALGYVVKGAGIEHLVTALRSVAAGRRFLDPAAESGLTAGPEPEDDEWERLTPRERLVLRRVAEGRTNREIATELSLSPKTVDTHRTNLMRKLGVHDAQALRASRSAAESCNAAPGQVGCPTDCPRRPGSGAAWTSTAPLLRLGLRGAERPAHLPAGGAEAHRRRASGSSTRTPPADCSSSPAGSPEPLRAGPRRVMHRGGGHRRARRHA